MVFSDMAGISLLKPQALWSDPRQAGLISLLWASELHTVSATSFLGRIFVTAKEFQAMEKELEDVKEELKCLKWKVRHIGETVQPLAEDSKRYNGYTLTELKAMVQFEDDPYKAAHKILTALFSDVYLLQHSVTEQACNSRSLPKPKIDPELYTVYCDILKSIFPGISSQTLREETQHVQKSNQKEVQ